MSRKLRMTHLEVEDGQEQEELTRETEDQKENETLSINLSMN